MIKKAILFCLFLIISLTAVSCANTSTGYSNVTISQKCKSIETPLAPIDLNILCRPTGLFTNLYATTDNGCYFLDDGYDSSSIVSYIDFATNTTVALTSDINAVQNDESTARIENLYGGAVPLVDKNHLYILKFDCATAPQLQDRFAKIYRMDLNGQNRNFLTLPANQKILPNCAAVSYGDAVIFMTSIATIELTETVLTKIDFSNNSVIELAKMPKDHANYILGVFEDNLVVKSVFVPEETKYSSNEEYFDAVENRIAKLQLYSLSNGSFNEIFEFGNSDADIVIENNAAYMFEIASQKLNKVNLKSGEKKLILDLSDTRTLDGLKVFRIRKEIFDGKLIFDATPNDKDVITFSVDTLNNKIQSLTLVHNETPVSIISETKAMFLVKLGNKMVKKINFAPDGTKEFIEAPVPHLALMKKDDFWNNKSVYTEINNLYSE